MQSQAWWLFMRRRRLRYGDMHHLVALGLLRLLGPLVLLQRRRSACGHGLFLRLSILATCISAEAAAASTCMLQLSNRPRSRRPAACIHRVTTHHNVHTLRQSPKGCVSAATTVQVVAAGLNPQPMWADRSLSYRSEHAVDESDHLAHGSGRGVVGSELQLTIDSEKGWGVERQYGVEQA